MNGQGVLLQKNDNQIMGMPIWVFSLLSVVTIVAGLFGVIPKTLAGGLLTCAVIGGWLNFVVDKVQLIGKTIGIAFIVIACSAMVYLKVIPQNMLDAVDNTISGGTDFLAFYVTALLTGSILGMNRDMLIKSGIRYALPVLGGVAAAYLLAAVVGPMVGISWKDSIMFTAAPIMGGGMGAGIVPMSDIYSKISNVDKAVIYARLLPMAIMGEWVTIFAAAMLNKLGQKKPALSGNGVLMKGYAGNDNVKSYDYQMEFGDLMTGLLLSAVFLVFGILVRKLAPPIHSYAFMIIAIALTKISGILPNRVEFSAVKWYNFISQQFTIIIMAGTGLTMTDLASLLTTLQPQYVILVVVTVLGAILGAGFCGLLVRFYFVESAITAGLCMANCGGTGDIMVLGASERMGLMSYAQISSRLGGGLILIIQSFLATILL